MDQKTPDLYDTCCSFSVLPVAGTDGKLLSPLHLNKHSPTIKTHVMYKRHTIKTQERHSSMHIIKVKSVFVPPNIELWFCIW